MPSSQPTSFQTMKNFLRISHKISPRKIIFTFVLICIFESGIRQVTFGNCHKVIQTAEHVQCHVNSGPETYSHSYLKVSIIQYNCKLYCKV